MGLTSSLLIALGVSMDAFAVATAKSLCYTQQRLKHAFTISFSFGFFQAFMPTLGLFVGNSLGAFISFWDHWIAFFILGFIGAKMFWEGFTGETNEANEEFCYRSLLFISLATSIDALMIGVSLPFFKVSATLTIVLMGIVTFGLSMLGAMLGEKLNKWGKKAELFGGVVLIALGVKILIEHLYF